MKLNIDTTMLDSILHILQSDNEPYTHLKDLSLSDLFSYQQVSEDNEIVNLLNPLDQLIQSAIKESKYGKTIITETTKAIVSLQTFRKYQYIIVRVNWPKVQKEIFKDIVDYAIDKKFDGASHEDGMILAYFFNFITLEYEFFKGIKWNPKLEWYYLQLIKNLPPVFTEGGHGGFIFEDIAKGETVNSYRSYVKEDLLSVKNGSSFHFEELDSTIIPINLEKDRGSLGLIVDLPLKITEW